MAKGNRGGKRNGGNSNDNILKNNTGFSFKNQNGKTVTMQITQNGVILMNGSPNKSMTLQKYQALYNAQKDKAGFKTLSSTDLQKMRDSRYVDYQSHDYELVQTGKGRGKVYRPGRKPR